MDNGIGRAGSGHHSSAPFASRQQRQVQSSEQRQIVPSGSRYAASPWAQSMRESGANTHSSRDRTSLSHALVPFHEQEMVPVQHSAHTNALVPSTQAQAHSVSSALVPSSPAQEQAMLELVLRESLRTTHAPSPREREEHMQMQQALNESLQVEQPSQTPLSKHEQKSRQDLMKAYNGLVFNSGESEVEEQALTLATQASSQSLSGQIDQLEVDIQNIFSELSQLKTTRARHKTQAVSRLNERGDNLVADFNRLSATIRSESFYESAENTDLIISRLSDMGAQVTEVRGQLGALKATHGLELQEAHWEQSGQSS